VHVARPGADRVDEAPGTPGGGSLLCVAAVVPHKGHDLLIDALTRIAELPWRCTWVGALDRDPPFVERLRRQAAGRGILDRIRCTGPLVGEDLRREYRAADLLVLPSRLEAYGMVVAEALAAGLPVVATAVGGVPEALGSTPAGPPGLLVPPDDAGRLRDALAAWLRDPELRSRLRRAARERRTTLQGWDATARQLSAALDRAGAA
jgi:glycosyltransferase involved in cell wall biosynthesis